MSSAATPSLCCASRQCCVFAGSVLAGMVLATAYVKARKCKGKSKKATIPNVKAAAESLTKPREEEKKIVEEKKEELLYSPDGPVAQRIAAVVPYYPFKGIERFYDIGGFLKNPEIFHLVIDAFVSRYRKMEIDSIGGFDARGLVLGPPIALALNKPFFMLRKKGKMPNSVTGQQYTKEYAGDDALCIPRDAVTTGQRVLLIDDLVATGGTLIAGIELVQQFGGLVVECGCVVEIKHLNARQKFAAKGYGSIPIWGLVSEDILSLQGTLHKDYVDDGEKH